MTESLTERCEELRLTIIQLAPLMFEARGNPAKLGALAVPVARLRATAAKGSDGTENAAYLQWLEGVDDNLAALDEAITQRDGEAAWAAFADQQKGVNLLSTGCAGYPGW